ncbi:MAG: hypothetical protein WBO46_19880, partial [Caldilineaceae bacterium]
KTLRDESLGIEEPVSQIVNASGFPGIDDFLGEIVVGEIFFVLNVKAVSCLFGGYLGLIEVLKRIVVSRFVLPGEYREKRRQEHALKEKDGEEEGDEKCWMTNDFHDEGRVLLEVSLRKGLIRVYYRCFKMALF